MTTALKVGGFVAALAVLFGAAFGTGRLVADDEKDADPASPAYALRLAVGTPGSAGAAVRLSVLRGDDVLTRFATRHEKKLHLIAVRQDFGGYLHLHPAMDAAGEWTVDADLGPGRWRFFADFQPAGGDPVVVHADATVAGDPTPAAAASDRLRRTVDGYDVDLAWNPADAGITFTVSRDGVPVTDLEQYLGAYGHLVALGDPDLEFLHVHPQQAPPGPVIPFALGEAAPGRYRLYLEFQHEGTVHTAPFGLHVGATGSSGDPHDVEHEEQGDSHGDH